MCTRKFTLKLGAAALIGATLAVTGNAAFAAEYWLKAGSMPPVTMPDGSTVVMWGYAKCIADFATCDPASVPGPALYVAPGDTTLKVHLQNTLAVPTSLVIHGLIKPMAPIWTEPNSNTPMPSRNGSLSARVRSFDKEVASSGDTGSLPYEWANVLPGTYLYQSGTQSQVQVQMGLYGAVVKNEADAVAATASEPAKRGKAYPDPVNQTDFFAFDNEATLLYSEIDPALHAAVATDDYGPLKGTTSTINYAPKYFLINGKPYQFGAPVVEPAGAPGVTRLRLLNAGLTTHVPMIQGRHWDVIAEDGKPYPFKRTQYTAMLTAAKTLDVLLTPEIGATYAIVDRRLSLSNNGLADGGMLAFLRVTALGGGSGNGSNGAPTVQNQSYDSVKGVTLNKAAPGVLEGASDPQGSLVKAVAASGKTAGNGVDPATKGTFTVNANGSFTYVPSPALAAASDTFTYQATDGQAVSAPATVTINFQTPTAPSLGAVLDEFNTSGNSLGNSWDQQTPTAPQFPDLGVTNGKAIANSTALGGLAIWKTPSFGTKQGASFDPGSGNAYLVLKATGGSIPGAPANYVRVGCEANQIVVSTMMGGSNISSYVKQASMGACGSPLSAVVDAKGLVTVFVGATFAGGVQLPDVAAWKGPGRIGIQLTTVGATADNFSGGNVP